jgi:hypothetical protein
MYSRSAESNKKKKKDASIKRPLILDVGWYTKLHLHVYNRLYALEEWWQFDSKNASESKFIYLGLYLFIYAFNDGSSSDYIALNDRIIN